MITSNFLRSRFPESLFSALNANDYINSLYAGMKVASELNVVITGLCKNIAPVLDHTISRLYQTAQLFGGYKLLVYENDSSDGTAERLRKYAAEDIKFILMQEPTGHMGFDSISREIARPLYLGQLRNRCQEAIEKLSTFHKIDYVIVIDLDLEGGWSYDGILNSFSYDLNAWSAMTANGLFFREKTVSCKETQEKEVEIERLFHDTWAYRKFGDNNLEKCEVTNLLRFERGEKPFGVFSNFNGLGIYKLEDIIGCKFGAEENEDGTVTNEWAYYHKEMRKAGKSIFLNPNLITLYSPHEFSFSVT